MPTYLYRRQDGSTFEIEQRITDPRLSTCPTTGQKVTRLISGGAGLVFKGSGFYLTDYVRNGKKDQDVSPVPGKKEEKSTAGNASDSSGTETKKESKTVASTDSGKSSD
jgi:putative FmdB family regulatory protein